MTKNTEKPRILISTGIYPPELGGPAIYARALELEFQRLRHPVRVRFYTKVERTLPTGLRHLYYFLKVLPSVLWADQILALDTFSVGVPTLLAAKLLRTKMIVRTGGDFLWEGYVERTGDLVLLRNFYNEARTKWNLKERIIFRLTKWVLGNSSALVFSTNWQKEIFTPAYDLKKESFIIENYYGEHIEKSAVSNFNFIGSTRPLKWKNIPVLEKAFEIAKKSKPEATLDKSKYSHAEFLKAIKESYAVIIASLGDISPNTILDAISTNTPFILTRENGLIDRIGDIGVYVDPQSENDIARKVEWLCEPSNYETMKRRVSEFSFRHSWSEIASEFLNLFQRI